MEFVTDLGTGLFGAIPIVVALVFVTVGAFCILGVMAAVRTRIHRLRTWQAAQGVVTRNSDTTTRQNRTVSAPVVKFTTMDGRQMVFTSSVRTSWRSYQPGDFVRVTYNPNLPDEAEIASFTYVLLTPLTFLAFGIIFAGLGVYIFLHRH